MNRYREQTKNSIRFDEVLVTDALAWTLFGMVEREGFLYTAVGEDFCDRPTKAKDRQAVLSRNHAVGLPF